LGEKKIGKKGKCGKGKLIYKEIGEKEKLIRMEEGKFGKKEIGEKKEHLEKKGNWKKGKNEIGKMGKSKIWNSGKRVIRTEYSDLLGSP